jgi:hypothetical protein
MDTLPELGPHVGVPSAANAGDDTIMDAPTTVAPPMPSFLSASRRSINESFEVECPGAW